MSHSGEDPGHGDAASGEDAGPDDGSSESPVTDVTVFLVLGAGLIGLFLGLDWFWMVWVVGFVVLVPIVSIVEGWLRPDPDSGAGEASTDRSPETDEEDALDRLKRRYAEGKIDEVEFERRLEDLVETESADDGDLGDLGGLDGESVGERGDRTESRERDRDREYEFET